METISSKHFLTMFRDMIRPQRMFPSWMAAKHGLFIGTCRASMAPEALKDLCRINWYQMNDIFTALLADHIDEAPIRGIFERMTPAEALCYEERLLLVEKYLEEQPEIFLPRDPTRGEMFWIDLLKWLLVIPCPPPL